MNLVRAMSNDGVNELDEANDDVASERINKLLENEFVVIKDDNGSQRQVKGLSLMEIWYLPRTERIVVECSEEYIPNNKASYLLSSFCYDIVKRGSFAPISILNSKDPAFEPYKTKMRKIIEGKFMYSDPAGIVQKWVFRKMNTGWRAHKVKLKKIFETHKTVKAALQKAPDNVVLDQWRILVADWGSEKKNVAFAFKQCAMNQKNAKKQKHHHTLGRKSCARKRKQMEDGNDGEVVDRLTLWEVAHKKKDGSYINEATKEKMIEANYLKETLLQNSEVDASLVAEKVFKEVMGPERGGYVRGIGIGPSPTEYFRMKSSTKSNGMSSNSQISTMTEHYERKIATLKEHHDMEIAKLDEHYKKKHSLIKKNNRKMTVRQSRMEESQRAMFAFLAKKHPDMVDMFGDQIGNKDVYQYETMLAKLDYNIYLRYFRIHVFTYPCIDIPWILNIQLVCLM